MIKTDTWIRQMATEHQMISPFVEKQKQAGVVSYGLDSTGYDIRLSRHYKRPNYLYSVGDPHDVSLESRYKGEISGDRKIIVPPGEYVLVSSLETFKIPRNIQVRAVGKSTYARIGLIVNIVDTEPEYKGKLTFSLVNPTKWPITVHAEQGIASLKFYETDGDCEVSYAEKGGKYQGTSDAAVAKIKKEE